MHLLTVQSNLCTSTVVLHACISFAGMKKILPRFSLTVLPALNIWFDYLILYLPLIFFVFFFPLAAWITARLFRAWSQSGWFEFLLTPHHLNLLIQLMKAAYKIKEISSHGSPQVSSVPQKLYYNYYTVQWVAMSRRSICLVLSICHFLLLLHPKKTKRRSPYQSVKSNPCLSLWLNRPCPAIPTNSPSCNTMAEFSEYRAVNHCTEECKQSST